MTKEEEQKKKITSAMKMLRDQDPEYYKKLVLTQVPIKEVEENRCKAIKYVM